MEAAKIEHEAIIWMVDDIPVRMVHAGRRWVVTDVPTRLRESVWTVPVEQHRGLYGWRFQGTDPDGVSFVFDVYRGEQQWHVHRVYS